MKSFHEIAASMYAAYCKSARGSTLDGHPLPTWIQLGENRQACWIAAAKQAFAELAMGR